MTTRVQAAPRKKLTTTATQPRRTTSNATNFPTRDEIALRAYELYEKSGCRSGTDVEFWVEAESQLRRELGTP